jgi:glycine/D-amino acid oxidase-like deaminating enzyme
VNRRYDAIVIGAGIAGTGTAYHLRKAGLSVALIDANQPGWAASGRNPGFLWLQTKAAGVSMQFSLACRQFAEGLTEVFPDFGFRACGGLIIYRAAAFEPVARAFVADRVAAGLPVELLDRAQLLDLVPDIGPEVSGAVWNPLDAHQDTRKLLRHVADAFVGLGGAVISQTRVARILTVGGAVRGVRLADGAELATRTVVVAGGPWTNDLLRPLDLAFPFLPVRFEAAETVPAPFRLGPVVAGQSLFRFFTPPGVAAESLPREPSERILPGLGFTEQIASHPDGSLQFGCAYEVGSDLDQATVAGQAMACSIHSRNFPVIAGLAITRQWAGVVAQTPDGLPVIDAATGVDGLVINSGHFFGNLAGVYSGRIVADCVNGATPPFDPAPFSRERFGTQQAA